MQGHLNHQRIIVQQRRVREELQRTDPEGVAFRSRCSIHRRVYHVDYPQELWYVDGHHKLIKYALHILTTKMLYPYMHACVHILILLVFVRSLYLEAL